MSKNYDNFILFGDFNNEPEEKNMSDFLKTYHLKNIVKQKTCLIQIKIKFCLIYMLLGQL